MRELKFTSFHYCYYFNKTPDLLKTSKIIDPVDRIFTIRYALILCSNLYTICKFIGIDNESAVTIFKAFLKAPNQT